MKATVLMAMAFCVLFFIPLFYIIPQAMFDWDNSIVKKWFIILVNDIDLK